MKFISIHLLDTKWMQILTILQRRVFRVVSKHKWCTYIYHQTNKNRTILWTAFILQRNNFFITIWNDSNGLPTYSNI